VLALEVAFRVAGHWLEPSLAGTFVAPPDVHLVVCVGDSHTAGHPDPNSYPAALEQLLNARATGRWRVINLGIPGLNTTQVRKRFARALDYYQPAIVLQWAGINNFWNHAELEDVTPDLLTRLMTASRVVRMVRVAVFYRRLNAQALAAPNQKALDLNTPDVRFRVNYGGVDEEIRGKIGDHRPEADVQAMTRRDTEAMMAMARERGIAMLAVTYTFWTGYYGPVNTGLREASATFGVPVIDAMQAVAPAAAEAPGEKLFDDWVHPLPRLYREIAEQAYRTLVEQNLVTPRADAPGRPG
jgi:lysophospholipase L1-like esterase